MRHLRAHKHIDPEGLIRSILRPQIFLVLLIWFGAAANSVQAREVRVEEVAISLHNKPVTGFKVLLDRSPTTVSEQIVRHVAAFDKTTPFQYDQTIIFENIRYRAITSQRPVSLYFVIRQVPGSLTEVVYVAMYDYRRAINSREFPGLSLKLQADLARIVRRTTGDILQSDALRFDDQTLASLTPPEPATPEESMLEHFEEEEVENNGVLLNRDPFEAGENNSGKAATDPITGGTEEVRQLQARVRELELRQAQLEREVKRLRGDQAIVERKNEQLMLKLRDSKSMRDSIVVLNRRVEEMLSQYYVADDFSVSSEAALEMQSMSRRVQQLEARWRREKARNDSLMAEINDYEGMLATVSKSNRQRARERRELQAELKDLRQRPATVAGDAAPAELDSLQAALDQQADAQRRLSANFKRLQDQQQNQKRAFNDLERIKAQQDKDLKRLAAENSALRVQIRKMTPTPSNSSPNPLRDSLRLLAGRLQQFDNLQARADRQAQQITDQKAELQQQTQAINQLKTSLGTAQTALLAAQERSRDLETELGRVRQENSTAAAEIQSLKQAAELQERESAQMKRRLDLAEADLAIGLVRSDRLRDSLSDSQAETTRLGATVARQAADLGRQIDTTDALRGDLDRSRNANLVLRAQVSELEYTVDSLARYSIPSDDQGQFIREQWTKLQKWEQELKDRDLAVADKEKLMAQRERYLADQEADIEAREARLKDIQEREKRVQVLERQRGSSPKDDPGRINVRFDRIIEFGELTPVFAVNNDLSPKVVQERVEAWFKDRGETKDQSFPDVVFDGAYLSELGTQPWNIRVRIDEAASGSLVQISFQAEDGTYLGADGSRSDQETAEQLIESMLRYQP